jgi:hypothetical protein
MADDIVTRLREQANGDYKKTDECMLNLAADEIERLTADRDRWRSLAERAMDLLEEANKVLATIQEAIKND